MNPELQAVRHQPTNTAAILWLTFENDALASQLETLFRDGEA
jgi:hypothetical protein